MLKKYDATINSQSGSSLIQVIIAASIMSILSLAMASLITDQRKATNYLEDQLEKIQLIRNIETILKDDISCGKTLNGVKIPSVGKTENVSSIRDNTGNEVYKTDTDDGHLTVGKIKVKNQSVAGPNSSGFVEIEVPVSRVREGGGPKELQSYKSKLLVSVDGSKIITSCSSSSGLNSSDISIKEKEYITGNDVLMTVKCDTGYLRVGCSGVRTVGGIDSRYEEDHGYLGAFPIPGEGCTAAVDMKHSTKGKVTAYCVKSRF